MNLETGEAVPDVVRVPRIETDRVVLRALETRDFEDYAKNLADPVATEHLSGVTDRRTAWRLFAAACGTWMLQGAGWWGVEQKGAGKLVGAVGAFFRETSPDLELGWMVYRPFWGQGFATEAAGAALAHGVATHADVRVVALIAATNVASVRVSEKLGLRYDAEDDLYGLRIGRYTLPR